MDTCPPNRGSCFQVPLHPKQEGHQEDKEICAQTSSTISLSDKSKILQQQSSPDEANYQ